MFPGFETLDIFGPLEMFGHLSNEFQIFTVAETIDLVKCQSGKHIAVNRGFLDSIEYDILLVPGGPGVPVEEENPAINKWLIDTA